MLGIKVTDALGQQIGPFQAACRSWPLWVVGIFTIVDAVTGSVGGAMVASLLATAACIVVAFTEQKQGLRDIMAGTPMVRKGAQFQVSDAYAEVT